MARFITVARLAAVPAGSARAFTVEGRHIAILNCGDTIYAVDNICSHEYAELSEGELDCDEETVECPLHGSIFDLRSGRARTLPATRPVATYEVRVEDDQIQLALP